MRVLRISSRPVSRDNRVNPSLARLDSLYNTTSAISRPSRDPGPSIASASPSRAPGASSSPRSLHYLHYQHYQTTTQATPLPVPCQKVHPSVSSLLSLLYHLLCYHTTAFDLSSILCTYQLALSVPTTVPLILDRDYRVNAPYNLPGLKYNDEPEAGPEITHSKCRPLSTLCTALCNYPAAK